MFFNKFLKSVVGFFETKEPPIVFSPNGEEWYSHRPDLLNKALGDV